MTVATARQTGGPVVDTTRSGHVRLRPVSVGAVRLEDDFWAPRLERNRTATLPTQLRLLWDTGRIDNFRRVSGAFDGPFAGRFYNDSDVYKWLEAASWSLMTHPDPDLDRQMDEVIAIVAAAQRPDGYLNSYFALERAEERWTDFDLHEMYCAGHLFQAAVAHHRATGKTSLLQVATRMADHIDAVFGPAALGKRTGTDGHPEVEMGLVELARETGEWRYVELAKYLVDVRGHGVLGSAYGHYGSEYHQDHKPFRELDEIVGHAVRAVYLNAGAADLYAETGEDALLAALHRLWQSMTTRKMYVSGGIGSRWFGEAFGPDYDVPNAHAYTETCAAIGSIMWNWRHLLIEGERRYADLIEWTLYNAVLPGVSLDGDTYFYQNPLADDGGHRRQPWFQTACCPPNVARLLASLPGYLYSLGGEDEIWCHLYTAGSADLSLPDGRTVTLRQQTRYPWDGEIAIEVRGAGEFALRPRIPAWCDGATLRVNDVRINADLTGGSYATIRRDWKPGDVVSLVLPMPVRRLVCHPRVAENAGRVALARGPLLYCLEQVDHPDADVRDLAIPDAASFAITSRPDLLGGVTTLTAEALEVAPGRAWEQALYRPYDSVAPGEVGRRTTTVVAVSAPAGCAFAHSRRGRPADDDGRCCPLLCLGKPRSRANASLATARLREGRCPTCRRTRLAAQTCPGQVTQVSDNDWWRHPEMDRSMLE